MGSRRSRALSLSSDWASVFGKSQNHFSEEELLHKELPPKTFCTGSVYNGHWNEIGMAGFGNFTFPHKVEYVGVFNDSQFHGSGTLHYPMGQNIDGKWENGRLISWKFRFKDDLDYESPWGYCKFPDRRYSLSIQHGLQPPGKEYLTNDCEPRKIPDGCYDTGDGFYNPKIKSVVSANDLKTVLRIPTAAEEKWIMDNCRKAWDEPVGYRPELYKHWSAGRASETFEDEEDLRTRNYEDDEDDDDGGGFIERLMPKFSESDTSI